MDVIGRKARDDSREDFTVVADSARSRELMVRGRRNGTRRKHLSRLWNKLQDGLNMKLGPLPLSS